MTTQTEPSELVCTLAQPVARTEGLVVGEDPDAIGAWLAPRIRQPDWLDREDSMHNKLTLERLLKRRIVTADFLYRGELRLLDTLQNLHDNACLYHGMSDAERASRVSAFEAHLALCKLHIRDKG